MTAQLDRNPRRTLRGSLRDLLGPAQTLARLRRRLSRMTEVGFLMRTNQWLPIGGLATVLVVLFGAFAVWRVIGGPGLNNETQRQTYNQEISRIIFSDMSSNDIIVRGRPSGDGVVVERRLHWNRAKPVIHEAWQGDTLTVTAECPGSQMIRECTVDYIVDLPPSASVDIGVSSGDIRLEGMAGGAQVTTSSGDITLKDIAGEARLSSTSGDIQVRGLAGDSLDVRATSGDLALTGLSVKTVKASATSGDIDAAFTAAPTTVDATSTSGDMTITMPRSEMAYKVRMQTSSGDTDSDIGNTESGPGSISVRATSGDVAIRLA